MGRKLPDYECNAAPAAGLRLAHQRICSEPDRHHRRPQPRTDTQTESRAVAGNEIGQEATKVGNRASAFSGINRDLAAVNAVNCQLRRHPGVIPVDQHFVPAKGVEMHESLVEPSPRLKGILAHRSGGNGRQRQRIGGPRKSPADRFAAQHNDDGIIRLGVRYISVGEQIPFPIADERNRAARYLVEDGEDLGDAILAHQIVVAEQLDPRRIGQRHRPVHIRNLAQHHFAARHFDAVVPLGKIGQDCRRFIIRCIVGNEQVEIGVALIEDAGERRAEIIRAIAHRQRHT